MPHSKTFPSAFGRKGVANAIRSYMAAAVPGDRRGLVVAAYPFIPVIEMPSMKVFWVKKNRMIIGKATRVLAAMR